MLKIKDSVELEELEKFGFKPKYDENTGAIIAYQKKSEKHDSSLLWVTITEIKSRIRIYRRKKEVWVINKYDSYFDVDTLYDLIKADMVEKVEE